MTSDEIRFGPFRLDLRRREVLRDNRPVRLGGRPLAILCELASAGGNIVSKDDLMARLWDGRIVEEGNIHVHVSALRRTLDVQGDGHSYVVTVPGRGYRLAGLDGLPSANPNEALSIQHPLLSDMPVSPSADESRNRPPTIEKRLLTVISCELIGAASLVTKLDPEDLSTVIATLYQYWIERIARFGGVVTRLASDEMLAYFGFPYAHEHDAEQAVRAGLALIGEVGRLGAAAEMLPLRLGIATGAAVVGVPSGSNASEQGGLFGEPLKLATALRRTAAPNTLVISASTRRLVGDLFELRSLANREAEDLPDERSIRSASTEYASQPLRGSAWGTADTAYWT